MIVKSTEKKEKSMQTLVVELTAEEFEKAVAQAYSKSKKDIYVPGFRKGKAPRMVIEGMYGKTVFYDDAVELIAPTAFAFGAQQEGLKTVGTPSVTNVEFGEEDGGVVLTFETALYPEVQLGQYKDLEVEVKPASVSDEDVANEIARIQKRNARIETVDRAAKEGDTAVIDYEGFLEGVPFDGGKGEGYGLVLGSGNFVPGFEEQVIGMAAGEERDINVTFPEQYHEGLAGKDVVFHVKCNDVRESILPELDDEFAKDVSEFDTMEEYRTSVREQLLKTAEDSAESTRKELLLDKATENITVEIPDAMIQAKAEELINNYAQQISMQGMTLEQYLGMLGMDMNMFKTSAMSQASVQVKNELMLAKVFEAEGMEIADEDVEKEFQYIADSYGMELEDVKKYVQRADVEANIRCQKAANLIYETGKAVAPAEKAEEKAEEPAAE